MGLWQQIRSEGGAVMNGINALIKRDTRELSLRHTQGKSLSFHVRTDEKAAIHKPKRKASDACTLTLNLKPPKLSKSTSVVKSPSLRYSIMAALARQH